MLHLKKVLGAKPKEHVEAELATLFTPWGEALNINHVLEEHPSPQFARSSYRVKIISGNIDAPERGESRATA